MSSYTQGRSTIYCERHKQNHEVTPLQAEQLIYHLSYARYVPKSFCPQDALPLLSKDPNVQQLHYARITPPKEDPECPACGTWICSDCSLPKPRASRSRLAVYRCAQCGSTTGTMVPIHHRHKGVQEEHLEIFLSGQLDNYQHRV